MLDKILVDGASAAGAEVREEFTVEEIVIEDDKVVGIRGHGKGGESVTERAKVVVGADGRYSTRRRRRWAPSATTTKPPILSRLLLVLE